MSGGTGTATATGSGLDPGRKANKIVPIPPEFRRHTHSTERDLLVNDIFTKTNCTVVPVWDKGTIIRFDIHGSGAAGEQAVRLINEWMKKAHVISKDSSAWAKTPAFDVNGWYYDQIKEMEGDRKQKYKEPPPEDIRNRKDIYRVTQFSYSQDFRLNPSRL